MSGTAKAASAAAATFMARACDGAGARTSSAAAWASFRAGCAATTQLSQVVRVEASAGVWIAVLGAIAALLVWALLAARRKPIVRVVDFSVFKADDSWTFTRDDVRRCAVSHGKIPREDIDLLAKLAFRSGLGDATAVPARPLAMFLAGGHGAAGDLRSVKPGVEMAREEFEATCYPCVAEVLAKTQVDPARIKFVITNSSIFNPTPSLSAAIVHRFGMPDTTLTYSLGGMGCSAGVVALDLARQSLQAHPNSYALVVSHENITNGYYTGAEKSMLVPNVLFRSNGAAILLSSRPSDAKRAKYEVRHVVRTHMARDAEAYKCVWQTEDADHQVGVALKKELIGVAGRAVARNMARLGPLVLPLSEKVKYAAAFAAQRALIAALPSPAQRARLLPPKMAGWLNAKDAYTPKFSAAFDHVCIHTGGRGVIDAMESTLGFPQAMVEASRAALYRFGNTSSCSVWYELAYHESAALGGGVRRGARVWQIAFGSGFKVNSAVLVACRRVADAHAAWDGFDRAAMYALLAEVDADVAASRAKRAAAAAKAAAAAGEAELAAAKKAEGTDQADAGAGSDDKQPPSPAIKAHY